MVTRRGMKEMMETRCERVPAPVQLYIKSTLITGGTGRCGYKATCYVLIVLVG